MQAQTNEGQYFCGGYWDIIARISFLNLAYNTFKLDRMNASLKVVKDLCEVFPDIEGELCSRHSILFGKLKNTYNTLYDQLDPQNYIVVKGVLDLFSDGQADLCFGLENGVIMMSRAIDIHAEIYINGNHFEEEIIMTSTGQLKEGLHVLSEEITVAIETAIEDVPSEFLRGAILYLHSNIPEDFFHYRQVLLISIFLGVSLINNSLLGLPVEAIIVKLAKRQIFGNQVFLRRLFGFRNRKLSVVMGSELRIVGLEMQNRMVFCQLDLAKQDVRYERERRKQLQGIKQQILQAGKLQWGLHSMLQVCSGCSGGEAVQKLNTQNEGEATKTGKFIENYTKQLTLLEDFSHQKLNFQQLVSASWQLNSKQWKIHSLQVVELIEHIKTAFKLTSCMVVNESIALIVADKAKCTELLVFLRKKLNKGELKSKSLFKIEQELVQSRWNGDKHIGEKMFTSVPSCGVAIIDPNQSIWFQ